MAYGLSIKIGADVSGFNRGMSQADGTLAKFGKSIGPAIANVAKLGAAAAAAALAIGSVMVKQSLSSVDALAKMGDRLGIATEELQALRHAAELTGVQSSQLDMGLQRMTRRIAEAAQGTGEAVNALKSLGLSAKELAGLTPDEQFRRIAGSMSEVSTQGERVRLAFKLFDSEGVALVNTLKLGSEGLEQIKSDMDSFGASINRVDAKQIEQANDAMTRIWTVIRGIADRVAVRLAPIIQHIAERFTDAAKETKGFQGAIDTAFNVAITGAGYVANAFHGLQLAMKTIIAVAQTVRFAFTEAFRQIVDAFTAVNDFILRGVNTTIRALNTIPGVDMAEIGLLGESEFVGKVRQASDDAFNAMSGAWDDVKDKWSEPLPAEGFKKFLSDIQDASRKAAEESLNATQSIMGDSEEGDPVDEKFRERLAQRLDALRQSNLSESEAEQEKHARNLELLNESFANNLLTQEEWHKRLEEEEQNHTDRMNGIRAKGLTDLERFTAMSYRGQVQTVSKHLADMTAGVANENKKMFELNKVAGIANAIVSAYEGISLTMSKYPYPLNIGMAAAHAAAAFAQVSAIKSASFGGGGAAPSLAGGTAATPVTPVTGGTPQEERLIRVEGVNRQSWYDGETMARILEELAEDGRTRIVIA